MGTGVAVPDDTVGWTDVGCDVGTAVAGTEVGFAEVVGDTLSVGLYNVHSSSDPCPGALT